MKISVITVCRNSASTIGATIRSVQQQGWSDYEHLIVDGGSTDGTIELVQSLEHPRLRLQSGPDKGLYDAMNKGAAAARGDLFAFLNSDDYYCRPDVLDRMAAAAQDGSDAVGGGVAIVKSRSPERVVRAYPAAGFRPWMVRFGHMPPHPGFFVSREAFARVGPFDLSYRTAADFDWMVRFFLVEKLRFATLPTTITAMRAGGQSQSFGGIALAQQESVDALRKHGFGASRVSLLPKYVFKSAGFLTLNSRVSAPPA